MAKFKAPFADYKRNNRINIGHNFTEKFDLHDVVRLLLMKELRRKHDNSSSTPIYTEYDPDKPNEDYPDVWLRLNGDVYVWEIQSAVTDRWTKAITKQYADVNLTIVPLEQFKDKTIEQIKQLLKPYLI